MRFIVLRTLVEGSTIRLEGLTSLTQSASGIMASWINFEAAKTNCLEPEKCDLLSFDEEEQEEMQQNFEAWNFGANVACIGVDSSFSSPEIPNSVTSNESQESPNS